jgi:hypothetical protein
MTHADNGTRLSPHSFAPKPVVSSSISSNMVTCQLIVHSPCHMWKIVQIYLEDDLHKTHGLPAATVSNHGLFNSGTVV